LSWQDISSEGESNELLGELDVKDLVKGGEVEELGAKNLRLRICSRKWRNKVSRTTSVWRGVVQNVIKHRLVLGRER